MPQRILLVGDAPPSFRAYCGSVAACDTAPCDGLLRERLHRAKFDLAVAFASAADAGLFHWLTDHPLSKPMLAVLQPDDELLRAASRVADDFAISPVRDEELRFRLSRLLGQRDETSSAQERLIQELGIAEMVGQHPAFVELVRQIPRAARSHCPVLITGETGTGKELCARAIHHLSDRRHLPFVPVDCAAFPEHLFESEMFGHVRGAFTDARRDQRGLVALAGEGTLFLDEIDSLSITAQSKLLRFLQERSYRPIGSERFQRSGARILAACNQDLEQLIAEKLFRPDLYFRLNVLKLHLVPLRERRSDVGVLARHFLRNLAAEQGQKVKTLSPAALAALAAHDWPGNVRELYNIIQRAVFQSESPSIERAHIPMRKTPAPPASGGFNVVRATVIADFERRYIEDMLRQSGGNVTGAARLAEKDRRVFGRLMKRYNIGRALS